MSCANHPDREHVAFCQNCGKPLCQECTRAVGSAVFCEPCLAAKLAGVGAPPPTGGYTASPSGGQGVNYAANGPNPRIPVPGEPNPGLAALLGFIPGVGAMYNGQYAKGVVHLVVFAILVSLSSENDIFRLFVAGWICYQVIEAYHTARARRDGTLLPNPFGLNDLGERLGFGRAWPAGTPGGQTTPPPSDPAAPPSSAYTAPPTGYPPYTPPSAASWAVPGSWENYAPPPPPPFGAPVYPDPNLAYTRNRFPTGAIWLIGLGAIFLIGNAGLFHGFPAHWLIPFLLIGFGVWLFVRKMTEFGAPLADDGTPAYKYRLFHALRGPIWIMLVGVMFLLDSFHILSWGRSWPLFIIVAGLMAIFRGSAFRVTAAAPYTQPPPPATATPSTTTASTVPSNPHDQEGS